MPPRTRSMAQQMDQATLDAITASVAAAFAAQAQNQPPRVLKEAFKLPTFHGNQQDSRHVTTFLARVDAYFSSQNVTDDSVKLASLFGCFPYSSPAGIWYTVERSKYATFQAFVDAFKVRFALNRADAFTLKQRLRTFRQRESDSVPAFYSSLQTLFVQLGSLGETVSDSDQIHCFVAGLLPQLREVVSTKHVADASLTLSQLVTIAVQHEALLPRRRKQDDGPALRAANVDKERKYAIKKRNYCHFCKTAGHVWDDCEKIKARKAAGNWEDRPRPQKTP